jgi:glutamyl-tRNA synthetase
MTVTRIAPSPTGFMHIGTARTALFNWLYARAAGGQFIIRIDDTDTSRHNEEAVQLIYDTMKWLGLDHDHTFRQSQSNDGYEKIINLLKKHITTEENGALRLDVSKFIPPLWTDEIAGPIALSAHDRDMLLKGIIIRRGDGGYTYNFASIADDYLTGVTHIIRGVDHISNTFRQLAIYKMLEHYFGVQREIKFSHIGLITMNKKKLSKRDNAASILDYREQGFSADALLNFMLRLGWAESDGKTRLKITKDEAVKMFVKDGKMRNSPANLDLGLLNAIQKKYK